MNRIEKGMNVSIGGFLSELWQKGRRRWYEGRAVIGRLAGVTVLAGCAFGAGLVEGTSYETPLVVEVAPVTESAPASDTNSASQNSGMPSPSLSGQPPVETTCAFVGSKNSNKYHLPHCTYAKRIKPENRVCFASQEEAQRRGYIPGCIQ